VARAEPPPRLPHRRHLLILHLHQRTRRPAPMPRPRRLLLIRRQVEADEQQQIAAQDRHARERGELLAGALAHVGQTRQIGAGEVGVGGEVDEAEVDDELRDLQDGDVLLPPNLDAARGLEVVPVHDDVDEQVEGYGHPGDGGVADELRVAEEGGCAVVVGVEEGEGLLFEEEEDGVDEFEEFGQVVELCEWFSRLRSLLRSRGATYVV